MSYADVISGVPPVPASTFLQFLPSRGGFLLGSWTLGWPGSCFGQRGSECHMVETSETPAHYGWPLLLPLEHGHHTKQPGFPDSRYYLVAPTAPANSLPTATRRAGPIWFPKAPSEPAADDRPRRGPAMTRQTGPKQNCPADPLGWDHISCLLLSANLF